MSKDNARQILERIVGTKSKSQLADKFRLAFAEKYKIKQEEVKQGIVDKVYNKNKVERT
jgi:hypothetical protein